MKKQSLSHNTYIAQSGSFCIETLWSFTKNMVLLLHFIFNVRTLNPVSPIAILGQISRSRPLPASQMDPQIIFATESHPHSIFWHDDKGTGLWHELTDKRSTNKVLWFVLFLLFRTNSFHCNIAYSHKRCVTTKNFSHSVPKASLNLFINLPFSFIVGW